MRFGISSLSGRDNNVESCLCFLPFTDRVMHLERPEQLRQAGRERDDHFDIS